MPSVSSSEPLNAKLGSNSDYWFTEDKIVVVYLVRFFSGFLLALVISLAYFLAFATLYIATGKPASALIPAILLFIPSTYLLGQGVFRFIASHKRKRVSKIPPNLLETTKGVKCVPWAEVEQVNIFHDGRLFIRTKQGLFRAKIKSNEFRKFADFLQSKIGQRLILK